MDERMKLQQQIDSLFESAGAPASRAVYELKEELLANTLERYNDLVAGGMEPDAAFQSVVGSIGNVDELVAALPPDANTQQLIAVQQESRQRAAIITAISVGLYILAAIVIVVGQFIWPGAWMYAFAGGLLLAVIPTCLLVYSGIRYPKYGKGDSTLVEEFKEYNASSKRQKAITRAISVIIWFVTLILYFIASFATGAWYITWVAFLVAVCLQAVLALIMALKGNG